MFPTSTVTGREILAKDWSHTELGPIEQWSLPLRSTVALMLACPTPMFLAWGPELRCFYNDAYRPILGFRLATALGAPFEQVWASIWDEIEPLVATTLAGESSKLVDMPLNLSRTGEDEESWWTFTYSPAYDEAGQVAGLFCVTNEQTARVTNERRHEARAASMTAELAQGQSDLLKAEDQLRQSQKMEAIGQLTGGVAHDFNNLLTVIRGSVDLLRRDDLTPERHARYIDAIGETADRATKLTGQLLAFARRQALKPETFDVGASAGETVGIIRSLVGSKIELEVHVPDEQVFALADQPQLGTAIVNMAINARDAMNGEGRLVIAIGPVSGIPAIRSHQAVAGDFVAVTITDSGSGIEPERIGRIFEPFFTTKEVGHGTGLGLSQVFGFAKQSGGDIRVESEIGRGTTFTLYLPRAYPEAPPPDARTEEAFVSGEGICVLVVEDNDSVGDFAAEALRELGYDCVRTSDAEQALAELEKDCDRFHVVFSDVVMPGMSGLDLGAKIRQDYPNVPVVLTSGYSHVLAQNGKHGFELLHKPYSIEQLSRVLGKAIAWQKRRFSDAPGQPN